MMVLCCCTDACHRSPSPTAEFENVTRVADYVLSAPNPDGVVPYPRKWNQINFGTSCGGATDCGGTDEEVCYNYGYDGVINLGNIYTEPTGILPCGGGDSVFGNCYRATGNYVTYDADCHKQGWKGVQAQSVWPGRFGFINSGPSCCASGGQEQSKYTSMTTEQICRVSATQAYTNDCFGAPDNSMAWFYETRMRQTVRTDRYGNITRSGSIVITTYIDQTISGVTTRVSETNNSCFIGDAIGYGTGPVAFTDGFAPVGIAELSAVCGEILFWPQIPGLTLGDSPSYSGTAAELNALNLWEAYAATAQTTCVGCDPSALTSYTTNVGDSSPLVFTITDDRLSVDGHVSATANRVRCCDCVTESSTLGRDDEEVTLDFSYHQTVQLGDPLTWDEVVNDAAALLNYWPLNNDAVYPWRRDVKTWLQPYVTRHATASVPSHDWNMDEDCVFRQDVQYTGEILGAPLPAGYGNSSDPTKAGHWDFRHTVWRKTNDGAGNCTPCEIALGNFTPDEIPKSATQWTDNQLGASMYGQGALLAQLLDYNYGSSSAGRTPLHGCFMQKWAETLEEWPSLNYARACGSDHFKRDETDAVCVDSWSDPGLVVTPAPIGTWNIGDFIGFLGGVYEITGKTSSTQYDVALVQTTPAAIVYADVAKLRFPTAHGLCGRAEVVSATQAAPGDPVVVTVADNHWLWSGDTVSFSGVTGLATSLVATVTSDTTFTVPFPGTFTAYIGGGYVFNSGTSASDWVWDTTCSRHDYVIRTLAPTARDTYAQTEAQGNLYPVSSYPSVLCCSPNEDDSFPHGITYGFGTITADHCYGNEWRLDFLQVIEDPFWLAEHEPCDNVGSWLMDEYPCATGGEAHEYNYPPLVEPRLTAPTGAPSLPVAFYASVPMNSAGGSPCGRDVPINQGTVHGFRIAWEACTDWQVEANENC